MARDLNLAIVVRAVDRVTGPLRRIQAQTDRINEANRRIGRVARGAAVGVGLLGFGFKKMLDTAADFEDLRATLETVEGSSEKVRESMRWIENFAARTPFELSQVSEAFVRLRTYGLDPTGGLLRTLGDTAAAMGKPIMQAVEAIADAVTGENERLKEFGIRARSEAGGMIRYEYSVDGETRSARALATDRAGIQRTILGILDPAYGGAMDKRAKTFRGVISNIMDQITRFSNLVMESGPFQRITQVLTGFLDKVNKMAEDGRLEQYAELAGRKIMGVLSAVEDIIKTALPWVRKFGEALAWTAEKMGGWGNLALTLTGLYIARPFISLTAALKGVTTWSGKAFSGVSRLATKAAAPAAVAAPRGVTALSAASGGLFPGAARVAAPAAGAAAPVARVGMLARLGSIFKPLAVVLGLVSIKFLAIGAVVAVVAGLVYKYWQPIKAFLAGVWQGFTEALQPVIAALGPFFTQLGAWIAPVIEWFRNLFTPVNMSAQELSGFVAAGRLVGKMIGGLILNIGEFIAGLVALPFRVIAAAASLGTALIDAIVETMGLGVSRAGPGGLQRPLAQTLGAAAAGLALGAGAAGAGAGPGAAGAATVHHNYNFTFHQQPGQDARELAQEVIREIERQQALNRREAMSDEI